MVGLPSLRLRGDYLAIITLGFAQIIQVVIRNTKAVNGFDGSFNGVTLHGVTTITDPAPDQLLLGRPDCRRLSSSGSPTRLRFSTHGLAFLAVREDEIAAEAMGIQRRRKYKVTAFVISAFFTGVAGALFAHVPALAFQRTSFRSCAPSTRSSWWSWAAWAALAASPSPPSF